MRPVDCASEVRAINRRAGFWAALIATAFVCLAIARPAVAWVYPEHRALALLAVTRLDEDRRAIFEELWAEARAGDEQRFCVQGADVEQGLEPKCIDWAALSAIAGDHSCSSRDMLETASKADWILDVADVAAQLKADLAQIPVTMPETAIEFSRDAIIDAKRRFASAAARAARVNALRSADIRLQRADPNYATRAGRNNAHFLLARPQPTTDLHAYAALTLKPGSEINAIGVYANLHLSALQKASRLAHGDLAPDERRALARSALADEAFALHFLQDAYAAGHIAGTWGNTSQRQGTHDFYNQNGLEVFTWNGGSRSVVLMGDAHMRPEDADIAAVALIESLDQVLDVATGRGEGASFPYTPAARAGPDPFDICKNNELPVRDEGLRPQPEHVPFFAQTLGNTPVPSLGPGLGSMPRFRSEVGLFSGLAASLDGRLVDHGFVEGQSGRGWIAGLDLSFRAGFGLDGVMGEAGDGLVYGSIGFRSDSPSTSKFNDKSRGSFGGNLSAAIPARSAISTRLRMPFYVVPGDLLVLSPMYFISPQTYTDMAVVAANGGLIPWQLGWATAIGRFQFVLGRELGINFFGVTGNDQLVAPSLAPGEPARIVNFKSIQYDIPIAEYRPYRAFSTNQSSSVVFQLFTSVDKPYGASIHVPAGSPLPGMRTVWAVGLRLVFDWRYYY